jgi:hypothetical protein
MLDPRELYFQASNGSVALPVAGYDYNSDWTPLLAGLSPARIAASLAALGRVEDWRAGVGRCSCSLLSRPFVCECHSISTMPRFQSPPRRTQRPDFPLYALLFASPRRIDRSLSACLQQMHHVWVIHPACHERRTRCTDTVRNPFRPIPAGLFVGVRVLEAAFTP